MTKQENLIKKWVAALKSGEYKQDTGQLCSDNGYCCLGVLCDIYDKEDDQPIDWEGGDYYLPQDLQDIIGLKDEDGKVILEDETTSLVELNDEYRSFEFIAEVIENNKDQLFVTVED